MDKLATALGIGVLTYLIFVRDQPVAKAYGGLPTPDELSPEPIVTAGTTYYVPDEMLLTFSLPKTVSGEFRVDNIFVKDGVKWAEVISELDLQYLISLVALENAVSKGTIEETSRELGEIGL